MGGETKALMHASLNGDTDQVRLLLEKEGLDVNVTDDSGDTALISASNLGCVETVKLLVEKGADVTVANKNGWTALMYATEEGYSKVKKLLLAAMLLRDTSDGNDGSGNKVPLEWAEFMLYTLGNGNVRNELACVESGVFVTQWMEDPNKKDFIDWKDDRISNGKTMLHCAICLWRRDIANILLEHGANVNITDKDGFTALMYASKNGDTDTVRLLIEKGADIMIANKEEETALIVAFREQHLVIYYLLLETIMCGNKNNDTPVEWANIIFDEFRELKHMDMEVFRAQYLRNMEDFIDWKHDLIGDGRTMLHSAIRQERWDIMNLLLDRGANVNITDNDGWSALLFASMGGHTDIVKLLLNKGADIDSAENNGFTAFDIAAHYGFDEIVKLLDAADADSS